MSDCCHPFTGVCNQSENCPVRETQFPPLDLADQLPASARLPPAKPALTGSHALTAWGWAWAVAAIAGFFVTVYLRA